MKVLKWFLVLVGVVALIGAGVYTYLGWLDLQRLIAAAESMRSAPQPNPGQEIVLAIGLALASGLILGIGLGMPRRSASRIKRQTLEASATAREAEIRRRAVETPPARTRRTGDPSTEAPLTEPTSERTRPRRPRGDEEAGRGPVDPRGDL